MPRVREDESVVPLLRLATVADAPAIAGLFARAFHDDPVMAWAFPIEERRGRGLRRLYSAILRHEGIPLGVTLLAEEEGTRRVLGAAIWRPPRRGLPSWRGVPFALSAGRALDHNMGRMIAMGRAVSAAYPRAEHWYLQILAADPSAQRAGVGSALVRRQLEACDAARVPGYLETTRQNLAFYARFGFRVTGEIPIRRGPTQYSLWRDAPQR